MVAQNTERRDGSAVPGWARLFIIFVAGAVQVIPILAGAYLVGTAGTAADAGAFSAERLIAGLAFLGSAATMLHAVHRSWRGGRRLDRSPAVIASVALLVVGLLALMP